MPEGPGVAVLADWLRDRLSHDTGAAVDAVEIRQLARPGVGQSSETLPFDARWREGGRDRAGQYVLRVQPGPDGIFLRPDAEREFRVLDGVRLHSGVPVPRVRWLERDPAVWGAPFFVMDRARGVVPSGKPSIHTVGWLPTLRPDQRCRVAESAIDALAAIHAINWGETHAFLHRDTGSEHGLTAHLAELRRWYRWAAADRAYPITDAALTYVLDAARSVDAGDPVLLWGDARLGNVMFDETGARVSAVLDWECAAIGPAGVDVAHWLVFDEFATSASGVRRLDGYPDRAGIVARYQATSGRRLHDLDFFEVLRCLFLATTLIRQSDAAVRSGRLASDTRMGHENTVTQMLARRLGLPVPDLAPDYLRHRRGGSTERATDTPG